MDINNEMIDHLADLAKLNFNKEEKENIKNDLIRILTYVEKLNEVDTENVAPLIFMNEETNVLREDEPKQTLTKAEALLNAPAKDSDYFRVPKFIEK
ncbi:MAG: Asp-tRNA(Asn)/Glu-tRNA(Gln) amidotransferase subunit GatC [Bacteroidia bacterium]|nr:Asp-tRNA(Asn)/Glu-tRNA(Gln) amidotransferase subunit GatC [Bacteroidia bacterium]